MGKKSLGGAKYFEAMGRRDNFLGIMCSHKRKKSWPGWALQAYMRGRINQMETPKGVISHNLVFNDPIITDDPLGSY